MSPLPRRAGEAVRQSGGYAAYVPAALPPQPPVRLAASLWEAISHAERALGRLETTSRLLAAPGGVLLAWRRREVVDSVRLDGLRATVGMVLELGRHAGDGPAAEGPAWERAPRAGRRALLGELALRAALPRATKAPVRAALLRELHARAMAASDGACPGEWRGVEVWIGPPGSTIQSARFVPPPPGEVPALMAELDRFLEAAWPGSGLVRAALVYHQVETIQPFEEGSGLVNRLLVPLLLAEGGVKAAGLVGLSRHFLDRPAEYLRCLQAVRERGEWETWIEYYLRGLAEAADRASAYLEKAETMRREHRSMAEKGLGPSAGPAGVLLEAMLESPVVRVGDVARIAGRTFANANQLVARLVELGLLREMTGRRRNRRFRYEPYFRLLNS